MYLFLLGNITLSYCFLLGRSQGHERLFEKAEFFHAFSKCTLLITIEVVVDCLLARSTLSVSKPAAFFSTKDGLLFFPFIDFLL